MEYEELKSLWEKYDNKLDNLEKLNKKLLTETLIKRPQKKLSWLIFQNLSSLIGVPVVLIVALHPLLKIENIDFKFIIGCILSMLVVAYLFYNNLKSYFLLKNIDLINDSILETAEKIASFKNIVNYRQKYIFLTTPVLFVGIILIGWKGFYFTTNTILYMFGLLIFTLVLGYRKSKVYDNRIEKLKNEILDLKEYKD